MAKYQTVSQIFGGSRVAVPILTVEGTENIKISAINTTGTYKFIVKNYEGEEISDVSQNYNIEIISDTDETIEFTLYKDGEVVALEDKKTDLIHISNLEKEEHEYTLKISYNRDKSDLHQDILEDVQIKIHSEQEKI